MASIARFMGKVQFISHAWKKIVKGTLVHHGHIEKLLGN
jgi:hypothetical protein